MMRTPVLFVKDRVDLPLVYLVRLDEVADPPSSVVPAKAGFLPQEPLPTQSPAPRNRPSRQAVFG